MRRRLFSLIALVPVTALGLAVPASGQGVVVGATVRVTRTDATTYEARVTDVRPGASFEVFGREGRPFKVPLTEVRRVEATGRREPIQPNWTSERRSYDLYLLERIDGTVVEVAVAGWGMFRLERDGVAMGDYRTAFHAFEVLSEAGGAPAARVEFGFDAAAPPATTGAFRTLEITVLTAGTGASAAGVLVRVSDADRTYADLTDGNGCARFVVPADGVWTASARDRAGRRGSTEVVLTLGDPRDPFRAVVFLSAR